MSLDLIWKQAGRGQCVSYENRVKRHQDQTRTFENKNRRRTDVADFSAVISKNNGNSEEQNLHIMYIASVKIKTLAMV